LNFLTLKMVAIMPQRFHRNVTYRLLALWLPTLGTSAAQAADIRVQLNGDRPGVVHASLHAADDHDWTSPLRQIRGNSDGIIFEDVSPGRYAVQLFVDSNGNGQLDVSPRGIPQEPVGFSGNPGLFRGKPDTQGSAFEHGDGESQVAIRMRQRRPAAPARAQPGHGG
jgi:uncharacterized protein (DUF2141 family)|tara:strand:+ start:949 stop:1449 length:501 start_codon:yes stop_codon:yes gene_type:complete